MFFTIYMAQRVAQKGSEATGGGFQPGIRFFLHFIPKFIQKSTHLAKTSELRSKNFS